MDQAPSDGAPRWIEVNGRRWRTTDPAIPPALREELVGELMRARRAIKVLRSSGDLELLADARAQVQAAKVALGERGEPWWDEPSTDGRRNRMEAAILALAGNRAPEGTICPSDAARAIGGDTWRELLPLARSVARELAAAGRVDILQRGEVIDHEGDWTGPIRIRWARPRGGGAP